MPDMNTGELQQVLNKARERKELEAYLNTTLSPSPWNGAADYLNGKAVEKGLSKKQVVSNSGIYRTYAYQILQGKKRPSRNKLIALGIGIGLNLEEMQRALAIAGEGALYPRVKRDAILAFSLNQGLTILDTNGLLFDMGEPILE